MTEPTRRDALFTQTPSTGYFREKAKSYVGMYVIDGALVALCSVIWLLVIAQRKFSKRHTACGQTD